MSGLELVIYLIIAIQTLYWVFLYSRIFFHNESIALRTPERVSVIVAAKNEATHLKELIPLLCSQNYTDYEIIIALNNCTDSSIEVCDDMIRRGYQLSYFHIEVNTGSPKKSALDKAIQASTGKWLLFTDADCVPNEAWISSMMSGIEEKHEIVIGLSPYMKRDGFLNQLIQYDTFLTAVQYMSYALAGIGYMGVGRNLAYQKSKYLEVGGFEDQLQTLAGDDDLMVQKLVKGSNILVHFVEKSKVYSYPKIDFKSWYSQKLRHLSVGPIYPLLHKFLLGISNFSSLLFYILIIIGIVVDWKLFGIILSLRMLVFVIFFGLIARRMAYKIGYLRLFYLDFVYVIKMFILTISLVKARKNTWN